MVVGGGIGGLAAARALQRAGWTVRVLEQAPRLAPLGAGISLWPNAVRALEALRVPLQHGSDSTGLGGVRTSGGGWLTRTDSSGYRARYGAPLLAVHRGDLQQALVDSLLPDTLLTDARVAGLDTRPEGVVVRHTRGTHRVDLAVLADGLTSSTRHLVVGPGPSPRYVGYTAWRGVAELPSQGAATESWGRGSRFGIVPLADGRTYWFATANRPEGERAAGGEHAEVERRFADWHAPVARVIDATDPAQVLRHDIFDLRPRPGSFVRGRLLLVGDAAHAMTPDLGQGACQALEDGATLGVLVRSGADLDVALDRYDACRRPRARLVAKRSRQLGRLGQLEGRGLTLARDLLVRAIPDRLTERQLDRILGWQVPGGGVGSR